MRRLVLVGLLAVCWAAAWGAASAPAKSGGSCKSFTYRPLYERVTGLHARTVGCKAAHAVAFRYLRETSLTTHGNHTRQGHCFPSQTYGSCDILYGKVRYVCVHKARERHHRFGTVRCPGAGIGGRDKVVWFRLPF